MKQKITIGLFIDTFFPMIDGVVMVVDNYAKRLAKIANVIVFAPGIPGEQYDDSKFNYKVVRCKSLRLPVVDYSLPIPKLDKKFMNILNSSNLDIVHIHSPFTIGKVGVDYAKKYNIPVIGTLHSQYKKDFQRFVKLNSISNFLTKIIMKQYNRCDECWAVNNYISKLYYDEYYCKSIPKVMNNATDMMPVKNEEEAKKIIDEKHKINSNEKVFLFVGRINNLKNVFFIVNSLKLLKGKLNFKMLFVGSGQDEEKLKELIKRNNMEKEIIMCGKVTDRELLSYYYARADLFLFPSLYDASSIVQIEAASQKTPTLFIEDAVTADTITNNISGYTAKKSEEDYANRILEIINDKELYNKVCRNTFQEVYKNWDNVVDEAYNSYIQFIEDKSSQKIHK